MSADHAQAAPDHGAHGDGTHADSHDAHGHGEALGPIDVRAWGALLVGGAAGLLVAAVLYVVTTA